MDEHGKDLIRGIERLIQLAREAKEFSKSNYLKPHEQEELSKMSDNLIDFLFRDRK